jgi:hypothetical protein
MTEIAVHIYAFCVLSTFAFQWSLILGTSLGHLTMGGKYPGVIPSKIRAVGVSGLALVLNLATPSKWKRLIWAPVALAMLISTLLVQSHHRASSVKRNPIQTYALTVCFASLMAGTIALAVALYDIVQISFPESTNDSYRIQLEVAQSQQILMNGQLQTNPASGTKSTLSNGIGIVSAPSIATPNSDFYINQAIQSLIVASIVLFLCAGIFFFHWRLAKLKGLADTTIEQ